MSVYNVSCTLVCEVIPDDEYFSPNYSFLVLNHFSSTPNGI